MIWTESGLSDFQCALVKRLGFVVCSGLGIEQRDVIQDRGDVRVLRAEFLFEYFERALVKWFGFCVLAHVTINLSEVVRSDRRFSILGAASVFGNLKNLFRDRRGLIELFRCIQPLELGV